MRRFAARCIQVYHDAGLLGDVITDSYHISSVLAQALARTAIAMYWRRDTGRLVVRALSGNLVPDNRVILNVP